MYIYIYSLGFFWVQAAVYYGPWPPWTARLGHRRAHARALAPPCRASWRCLDAWKIASWHYSWSHAECTKQLPSHKPQSQRFPATRSTFSVFPSQKPAAIAGVCQSQQEIATYFGGTNPKQSRDCQEPLDAPFLNDGNGPLRHSGRRPIKVGKRSIKEGKWPIKVNGLFSGTTPHWKRAPLKGPIIRKFEKAVAVSGVCSGVPEENFGKVPGKLLENVSRIAKCYKFWDFWHRERQTCRNLGSTLPGPCPHLPCGMFYEIDSSCLLEFFWH